MPPHPDSGRFYFDVVLAGRIVRDQNGVACSSAEEALAEAAEAAAEYAAELFRRGEALELDQIIVRDAYDREAGRINLQVVC